MDKRQNPGLDEFSNPLETPPKIRAFVLWRAGTAFLDEDKGEVGLV